MFYRFLGVLLRVLFAVVVFCGFFCIARACPMFVEFFPDPTDVSDDEGEYVEIRLDDFWADSLYVQMDERSPLGFDFPVGNRFLLVHDSAKCVRRDSLACGLLGSVSLPNSRESVWRLWAGACRDSVSLPRPKAGRAFQRVGESDDWTFTPGTPGTADAAYELGIEDCGIQGATVEILSDDRYRLRGILSGCDSSSATLQYLDLFSGAGWRKSDYKVAGQFSLEVPAKGPALVRLNLPEDAAPANDTLDTLAMRPSQSPVVISEVHHCPQEPMPEWVEVFNNSRWPLPLSKLRFCSRGSAWGGTGDSLLPYESIVVSKDTAGLRELLKFNDVRLVYASMGYLNNTSGAVELCYGDLVIDSVSWSKETVSCPSGFNPLTGLAENTPGFQSHSKNKVLEEPFTYKLSSRIVSKKGYPLRLGLTGEYDVTVELQDSAGHGLWKKVFPSSGNAWNEIPAREKCRVGVNYVSMTAGKFKKVVGIVVRP